ncbi:MAG: hypothetical protein F6J93_40045 [Oscillatoria sp. SIO1A7]|nr:hypothetical protein [Oscillatoria sp. SIO1A7]
MSKYLGSLDDLKINTYRDPRYSRQSCNRHEAFVLGCTYKNTEGRTYHKMMQDCRLTLEQCQRAVEGLIEINMLISP